MAWFIYTPSLMILTRRTKLLMRSLSLLPRLDSLALLFRSGASGGASGCFKGKVIRNIMRMQHSKTCRSHVRAVHACLIQMARSERVSFLINLSESCHGTVP